MTYGIKLYKIICGIEICSIKREVRKIEKSICCFFGHRIISVTEELKRNLYNKIEELINTENVTVFLFGSKSQFNDLCYELVSVLREKYPKIKRIYVRAEYPFISNDYQSYLLKFYEETYYPPKVLGSNRFAYIKRNYEMIDRSNFCIVYYEKSYQPKNGKSGTKIALDYAIKKKKTILRFPE